MNPDGILYTLPAALLYGLITLSCIGWGSFFLDYLGRKFSWSCELPGAAEAGLVGLFLVGGCSVVLNFLLPVTGWITWHLHIAGAGLFFHTRVFANPAHRLDTSVTSIVSAVLIMTFCAWWSWRSGWSFDSGLYHLQALEWIRSEPVAVGLGNLHSRLAYNSWWLSSVAALNLPGLGNVSIYLADSLFTALAVLVLVRPCLERNYLVHSPVSGVFAGLALMAMSLTLILKPAPISIDQATALLTILVIYQFLHLFQGAGPRTNPEQGLVILLCYVTFALLTRISVTPLLFLALCAVLLTNQRDLTRGLLHVSVGLSLLVLLWVTRNLLLSGCLVFPVAFTCIDSLPWSVGSERAMMEASLIQQWARTGDLAALGQPPTASAWFQSWLQHPSLGGWFQQSLKSPLFLVIACSVILSVLGRVASASSRSNAGNLAHSILIAPVATLVLLMTAWFFTAPDPRFVWGTVFSLIALGGTLLAWPVCLALARNDNTSSKWTRLMILLVLACVLGLNTHSRVNVTAEIEERIVGSSQSLTVTGGKVNVPDSGNQCWQISIPCAPRLNGTLIMGRAGQYPVFQTEPSEPGLN